MAFQHLLNHAQPADMSDGSLGLSKVEGSEQLCHGLYSSLDGATPRRGGPQADLCLSTRLHLCSQDHSTQGRRSSWWRSSPSLSPSSALSQGHRRIPAPELARENRRISDEVIDNFPARLCAGRFAAWFLPNTYEDFLSF